MPDDPIPAAEPSVPETPEKMPLEAAVQDAMQAAEAAVADAVARMKIQ